MALCYIIVIISVNTASSAVETVETVKAKWQISHLPDGGIKFVLRTEDIDYFYQFRLIALKTASVSMPELFEAGAK